MNTDEMNELLEELLQSVRQYNTDSLYRQIDSTVERQKCKDTADRAWVTLESLFTDEPELSLEYVSRDEEGAETEILAQLQRWALINLAHRPGGRNSLQYSITCGDLDECKHQLDTLTADSPGSNRPAQWAFIKLLRVYIDSPILHTGLVLADLPGLRDFNYARVRATEKYLSHSCDEVFIVTNISRCVSDQSIQDIMNRCRKGQPRLIICTRSDDIDPEEAARGKNPEDLRVRQMNQRIMEVENQLDNAISRRQTAPANEQARISLEESNLNDRRKTLKLERKRYLVNRRNARVERDLAARYRGIAVFCVGNPMYSMLREAPPDEPEGYINLSGIRQLRRYCKSVPAQAQFHATSAFLNNLVPALMTSLRQWALAGVDSVTAEKAATLRRILGNMEDVLRREFISRDAHVSRAQKDLDRLFNESVTRVIRNFDNAWTRNSVERSEEWATWNHNTYAAWCRNYGTHQTGQKSYCCWNDEIVQRAREVLGPRWDEIIVWLESRIDTLTADTAAVFSGMHRELEEHRHLAPRALGNILAGMESRQKCITDEIHYAFLKLVQATHLIARDMLHGHASSIIAGLMRPAYLACNREYGNGSDRRRKNKMRDHLASSGLFANYSESARGIYLACVAERFDALQGQIHEQVQRIVRDLQVVAVADGAAPEAEQAPALAEEMNSRVEVAQRAMGTIHTVLQELASH
ncbi:hypothetical protein BDV59DRAFT_181582 [Aspergillus ambiguus]|uniref:uncharacterized protein n=1 Tax=Aspergillus ambiguus TaxID=176160 RepID=UPI003CCDD1E0